MSAPVHYDVEGAISGFLHASAQREAVLREKGPLPPRAAVQMRHRDAATALLRLSLEEANRATPHKDALGGAVDIFVEFLVNYVQVFSEEDRPKVMIEVATNIANFGLAYLNVDLATLPFAEISKQRGGHA